MRANIPFNKIKGLYNDVAMAAKREVPLSYPVRSRSERDAYQSLKGSAIGDFNFREGSIDKRRAGVLGGAALGAGYVATDVGARAITGGSMYRREDGTKDFVGVPFV